MSAAFLRRGLDIADYHGPAGAGYVSNSGLRDFAEAPAVFYGRHLDPMRPPPADPTPAQMLGTMTHTAVLEPDTFNARHVAAPKVDRRTKAGKADYEAFLSTLAPGQQPADPDMIQQAQAMAAGIRQIPEVRKLLAAGEAEVSAFYKDAATDAACRIRPDWIAPAGDGVILLDVKTCPSASAVNFVRSIIHWRYDLQAAMYSDGWESATNQEVKAFVFVAVDNKPPYVAAAYTIPDEITDRARRIYRQHLARYVQCLATDTWPGYVEDGGIQLLTFPAWFTRDDQ